MYKVAESGKAKGVKSTKSAVRAEEIKGVGKAANEYYYFQLFR